MAGTRLAEGSQYRKEKMKGSYYRKGFVER
jgi:hypothetical protein